MSSALALNQMGHYRVTFLGDRGVGKTELFNRFLTGKPPKHPNLPTVAVDYRDIDMKSTSGRKIRLLLWDGPGATPFKDHGDLNHCKRMTLIFFVYNVTRRETYLHLPMWISRMVDMNPDARMIVLGTHIDIIDSGEACRLVEYEDAEAYARGKKCEYMEVCAVDTAAVTSLFRNIFQEIYEHKFPGESINWDTLKRRAGDGIGNADPDEEEKAKGGCLCFGNNSNKNKTATIE